KTSARGFTPSNLPAFSPSPTASSLSTIVPVVAVYETFLPRMVVSWRVTTRLSFGVRAPVSGAAVPAAVGVGCSDPFGMLAPSVRRAPLRLRRRKVERGAPCYLVANVTAAFQHRHGLPGRRGLPQQTAAHGRSSLTQLY